MYNNIDNIYKIKHKCKIYRKQYKLVHSHQYVTFTVNKIITQEDSTLSQGTVLFGMQRCYIYFSFKKLYYMNFCPKYYANCKYKEFKFKFLYITDFIYLFYIPGSGSHITAASAFTENQ